MPELEAKHLLQSYTPFCRASGRPGLVGAVIDVQRLMRHARSRLALKGTVGIEYMPNIPYSTASKAILFSTRHTAMLRRSFMYEAFGTWFGCMVLADSGLT